MLRVGALAHGQHVGGEPLVQALHARGWVTCLSLVSGASYKYPLPLLQLAPCQSEAVRFC